ncbi:MAG TPA: hypothetical protein VGR66_01585 [Candidatus Eisenbacteria bacterium]|nr:hypothetical protein [Candidatus Eisenbacteria bacterium]
MNAVRALPLFLRLEIVGLAVFSVVLLATYGATSYYDADPGDPGASLVTRVSRLVAAGLALSTLVLALLAPRVSVRSSEARGLAALPIPPRARAAFRADRLALLALPMLVLGFGIFLHPLAFGKGTVSLNAVLAWTAWLWAASQLVAGVDALCCEGRWGPGWKGFLGRAVILVAPFLIVVTYGEARSLTGLWVDLDRPSSFAVTALFGVVLGVVLRLFAARAGAWSWAAEMKLAEHLAIRRWKRRRARATRPRLSSSRVPRAPGLAWAAKDFRLVLRMASLRSQWLLAVFLCVAPIALVLQREPPAWIFAGLVLVLGAAATGIGVLLLWYHERPMFVFSAPVPRRVTWLAKTAPALALVLGSAAALSAIAAVRANAHTGRVLLLWTGVSGASLVLAAANLGQASPPRSPLGQNLYGLGLFSCVIVGSVYPATGWLVLAAFALYTLRSLARDPRS